MPAAWSVSDNVGTARATSLANWWSRFDDPMMIRLVADALRVNTTLLSSQAVLRQSRATGRLAASTLLPTVGGSASAQRIGSTTPAAGRTVTRTFQARLDANWELDIFGSNRSALDASEATIRATVANLGDVQVSVEVKVAMNYILGRSAQARLVIANSNLASQQETLQITLWRLQAGLVTSIEAEQARVAVEQTGVLVPACGTGIVLASHALAVLTGRAHLPTCWTGLRLCRSQPKIWHCACLPKRSGSARMSAPPSTSSLPRRRGSVRRGRRGNPASPLAARWA